MTIISNYVIVKMCNLGLISTIQVSFISRQLQEQIKVGRLSKNTLSNAEQSWKKTFDSTGNISESKSIDV